MIGRTILHYTIIAPLTGDRRGEAYLADDSRLRRRVVLVFPALGEPGARERFLREARAAARLSHPNIAAVHAVEEADGRVFAALEYVEGDRLRDRLTRGDIDTDGALDIAGQILAALSGAHETSVVHRRLSPDSIVVAENGRVKVTGFGPVVAAGDVPVAHPGSPAGTPAYVSPEQARGCNVDHRSDLFSFGVILCEMLTGHTPYEGDHDDAGARIPKGLQAIVDRTLEEDPTRRYQSAVEIEADLARVRTRRNTTSG